MLTPGPSRMSTFEQMHVCGLSSPPPPSRKTTSAEHPFGLTHRELDVISRLADCGSHDEIAGTLNISRVTVKQHVRNIYEKTCTGNLRALAILAIRNRLLTVEIEEHPSWMQQGKIHPHG